MEKKPGTNHSKKTPGWPTVTAAVVRIVPERFSADHGEPAPSLARRPVYRPLVVGTAILYRPHDGSMDSKWHVHVSPNGLLWPVAPQSRPGLQRALKRHRAIGLRCRLVAALLTPDDVLHAQAIPNVDDGSPPQRHRTLPTEIYGWSLLYQLPHMRSTGVIDAHERFEDLPAYYESALELIDRSTFLAAKGICSRPIALVTRPEDFRSLAGSRPCNKFFPHVRFLRPSD